MSRSLALLFAAAGISAVQAQVYACDSLQQPNYDSCDAIMATLDWNQGYWGPEIPDGNCLVWTEPGNIGNCAISACNHRGDGGVSYMNSFSGPTEYGLIKQWCMPDNAGGTAPPNYYARITAANNPDYKPGSAAFRAAKGQVVSKLMTIDEFKAFEERGKQTVAARNTSLHKRDPTWLLYGSSKNIRRDGQRSRMSAVASPGATQQWSTAEGYSTSVGTSAEMGVSLFEIFSASVSIEVTQETSVEYTYTLTFDAASRCDPDQSAVLYCFIVYPLFDEYVGAFDDAGNVGETITVWVPVDGENNYELDVECLG